MNRGLFLRLLKFYILFYVLRAGAAYMTYPFGLPVGIGWGVMIGLLFAWLVFRFYRYDVANRAQTAGSGDGLIISMGETVGADEPIPEINSPPPDDSRIEQENENMPTVTDGQVDDRGDLFRTDSVEWIVWLKTPETASFQVINSELGHNFILEKEPGTQSWRARREGLRFRQREVDAGLSEALNQERLEEIGNQLHGRSATA